jgi:hypothetical protein
MGSHKWSQLKQQSQKKSEGRVVNVKWLSEDGDACLKTKKKKTSYSRELVAGITNEHTGFANSSISNCNTFNELGSTHLLLNLRTTCTVTLLLTTAREFGIY